jgi:predicted Fe-Mo cluster-binding NifX family protein
MIIAIASTSKNFQGDISDQGGRAPYYLLLDEKNEILEVLKNPFAKGGGGAGFSVAKMLEQKNVNKLIAGKIGDNMQGALKERNIEYISASGLIESYLK